jgi:hypothetical protein
LTLYYKPELCRGSSLYAAVSENPVPPLVRGHHQIDVELVSSWAIECFQNVEFLSFRKMIGVEYLARFSSCLIEKGLDKVKRLRQGGKFMRKTEYLSN